MHTVNYLKDINCEHETTNRHNSYRKGHRSSKKIHRRLTYIQIIQICHQTLRMGTSSALMSPLEIHGAEW